jgi:integrase
MAGHYSAGNVIKARGKWRGQILYTDEAGNRKRLSKNLEDADGPIPCDARTNRGKNRALAALDRWRAELIEADAKAETQGKPSPNLAGMTVGEYLDAFLDELGATQHVEESTLTGYRSSARAIKADLGDRYVTDLTTADVQQWEIDLLGRGLSNRTATKHFRLLSQAIQAVVDSGKLMTNPCKSVKLPKYQREQPHAMTREQTNELLATLAALPQTREVAAARISLCSGMRRGEVCALTWADVDEAAGMVHVTKAIGEGAGGAYIKTPKNHYSVRDIPMTPQLADAFKARRSYVLAEAGKQDVTPSPSQLAAAYVLGDLSGSYPNPAVIGRGWIQLRSLLNITDAQGRPLKFHDLRHTYATLAIQAGADVKSLSSILGHKDASMTLNVYASSDEGARRLAAKRIGEFLGPTPTHGAVEQFRPTGTTGE